MDLVILWTLKNLENQSDLEVLKIEGFIGP